jgi:hypothetical protein
VVDLTLVKTGEKNGATKMKSHSLLELRIIQIFVLNFKKTGKKVK